MINEISPPIDFERSGYLEEKAYNVLDKLFEKYGIEEKCQKFTNNRQEWATDFARNVVIFYDTRNYGNQPHGKLKVE
ncbi:MAG: hypothetical protein LBB78_02310 [Spirochaetaceae bacterium]|jgi:hypothetical protein|nr:hypothetical protein [Spirochaetaceae bacterium]